MPTTPPVVTWTLWNGDGDGRASGEALPSSATDGPATVGANGVVPTCYAHTPTGALIALTQFELRVQVAHDADLGALTAADCVQDAGAVKDEQAYQSGEQVSDYAADFQVAGFEFISYTGSVASIELAMRQSNGALESASYSMQWQNGDWKAVLGADGSFGTAFTPISDLTGYVPWAGVV